MTEGPRKSISHHVLATIWAAAAVVMGVVVIWAATQTDDPLSSYIHTDKVRHILAFGAIGLCAAFMPSPRLKIVALAGTLTFAMLVEIIQIPIPDRTASLSDLFASVTGGFGGFGLGAAVTMVFDLTRRVNRRPQPLRLPAVRPKRREP